MRNPYPSLPSHTPRWASCIWVGAGRAPTQAGAAGVSVAPSPPWPRGRATRAPPRLCWLLARWHAGTLALDAHDYGKYPGIPELEEREKGVCLFSRVSLSLSLCVCYR